MLVAATRPRLLTIKAARSTRTAHHLLDQLARGEQVLSLDLDLEDDLLQSRPVIQQADSE